MLPRIILSILLVTYLLRSAVTWSPASGDGSYGDNIRASITSADVLQLRPSLAPLVKDDIIEIFNYFQQVIEGENQAVFTIFLTTNQLPIYGVARTTDFVTYDLIRCGEVTSIPGMLSEAIAYVGFANSWNSNCSTITSAVNTVLENYQFSGLPSCLEFEIFNDIAYIIQEESICVSGGNCSTTYYTSAVDISDAENPRILSVANSSSRQSAENIFYDHAQYPPVMDEYKGADSPNGKCIQRKVSTSSLIEYCSKLQRDLNPLLPGFNIDLVQYQKQQIQSSDHILAMYMVTNLSDYNYFFVDLKINTASNTSTGNYAVSGCGLMEYPETATNQMEWYVSLANSWNSNCVGLDEGVDTYARALNSSRYLTCIEWQSISDPTTFLVVYEYTDNTGTGFFGAAIQSYINYPNNDEDSNPNPVIDYYYIQTITYAGKVKEDVENMVYSPLWLS